MKVIRPKQIYDLVEVIWDDASDMEQGWVDKVTPEPAFALSAGFLVHQDANYVVLALDTDPTGQHNGRGQIPRGMVKKIKVLRKKDA